MCTLPFNKFVDWIVPLLTLDDTKEKQKMDIKKKNILIV